VTNGPGGGIKPNATSSLFNRGGGKTGQMGIPVPKTAKKNPWSRERRGAELPLQEGNYLLWGHSTVGLTGEGELEVSRRSEGKGQTIGRNHVMICGSEDPRDRKTSQTR